MSASKNIAILLGNLGKDPEMKYASNGKAYTSFSLATNESWTGQDGQKHEQVEWHYIKCWGRLAEVTNEYLHKGSKVLVEGSIHYYEYEATDGTGKKRGTEIRATSVTFLDTRGGNGGGGGGGETVYPTDEPAGTADGGYDGPPF